MNRYPSDIFRRGPRDVPYKRESKEPPWDDLDPGIRSLVRLLWLAGFEPTDSGDGKSKFENCEDCQVNVAAGMCAAHEKCALDVPHVFMTLHDASELYTEANRLHAFVEERLGVSPAPMGNVPQGWKPVHIEASYDPTTGTSVLTLLGVADEMLPERMKERKV
jgi:hypothetical protein